eukprot:5136584-Alexandrium_andersonii.AAC.1
MHSRVAPLVDCADRRPLAGAPGGCAYAVLPCSLGSLSSCPSSRCARALIPVSSAWCSAGGQR